MPIASSGTTRDQNISLLKSRIDIHTETKTFNFSSGSGNLKLFKRFLSSAKVQYSVSTSETTYKYCSDSCGCKKTGINKTTKITIKD